MACKCRKGIGRTELIPKTVRRRCHPGVSRAPCHRVVVWQSSRHTVLIYTKSFWMLKRPYPVPIKVIKLPIDFNECMIKSEQ